MKKKNYLKRSKLYNINEFLYNINELNKQLCNVYANST